MKPFDLEEYLENPSRKVVTRDGKSVTIHCTNFGTVRPVVAQIEGAEVSKSYTRNGKLSLYKDTQNDLFFAPEKKYEGWVNVFHKGEQMWCERIYGSEGEARSYSDLDFYAATIKIEWEE